MLKLLLLSMALFLSTMQAVEGSSRVTAPQSQTSNLPQQGFTSGEYLRDKDQAQSHKIFLDKQKLKLDPTQAYNPDIERNLSQTEANLYKAIEAEETSEKLIAATVEKISATMDTTYTSALKILSLGYIKNNHPDAGKYSQKDLEEVQNELAILQQSIKAQEDELEVVSQSLNEMTAEKEKLETSTPDFLTKGNKESAPRTLKTKKGDLKIQDPLAQRLKDIKRGVAKDSVGVAILAERFILKLVALDKIFDILRSKINIFRGRVDEDKAILKLMADDPELKQEGVALWEKLWARIFVVGKTPAGLTLEENNRLRAGLTKIKKILNDEVSQYEKVIKIFEDYAYGLPDKINEFKKRKIDFFKRHYAEVKTDLDNLHKSAIDNLIQAERANNKTLMIDLRNKTGSLKRQLYFLEQSVSVEPLTAEKLAHLTQKVKQSMTQEQERPSQSKDTRSIDDLLETLVTLTQIVQESGADVLNPVLKDKVRGFFGANLIKEVAIKSAPILISTLTGMAQSKLAELAATSGVVKNSPQLELLKIISQLNAIDSQLAANGEGASKDLKKKKNELREELAIFLSLVNCENEGADVGKRQKSCKKVLKIIEEKNRELKTKNINLSAKDQVLILQQKSLMANLAKLDTETKKGRVVKSSAKNEVQRQQESLGLIFDALGEVVADSQAIRSDAVEMAINNVLPEFQSKSLDGAKKNVVNWVVPLLSGFFDAKLEAIVESSNPDPTKHKYYDSGIVNLLTARIAAQPDSAEYQKLSDDIKKAYEEIMKVRMAYKKSILQLGSHEKKTVLSFGFGEETAKSKRQEQRLIQNARESAGELRNKSEKYSGDIKKQAGK
ncbi:MAG: hypothetical protein FJX03_02740 [Alphaproteobacteria bacterium]|nr:hypothetical protein [Alphaproteobacteria bacterium]